MHYLIWEISFSDWDFFFIKIGKNTYFFALEMGPFIHDNIGRKIPVLHNSEAWWFKEEN